MSDAFSKSIME